MPLRRSSSSTARRGRRPVILRRRPAGAPRRKIPRVAVPSSFTLLNLLSGFYSIIMASQGQFAMAAWLIVAAGLFDLLDGMMARLVDGASEFGVELDSLADIVSFGVAPAFLLYQFGLSALGLAGVVVAALPAICGSVRLARFNLTFVEKKDYFEGLPIPAQAAAVVAFILVFDEQLLFGTVEGGRLSILVPLVVVLSVLMVSTVRFDAIPKLSPRYLREHPYKALSLLVAIVLVVLFREIGLFITIFVYLGHGVGRALWWAFRTATEEPEPPDDHPLAPEPPSPSDTPPLR